MSATKSSRSKYHRPGPMRKVGALLIMAATAAAHGGGTVEEAAQLARRLESVETLIERSSAAKQIEREGGEASNAQRDAARRLHRGAHEAYAAGDYGESRKRLEAAAKTMVEAARQAAPAKVTADKSLRDFDARLESIHALMAALERVGREKNASADAHGTLAGVQAMVAEAKRQAQTSGVDTGRATLDQAYLKVKMAINGMRGGDTLVRSLDFATKEEEFDYEVVRNRDYEDLVPKALERLRPSRVQIATMEQELKEGRAMRSAAIAHAARREFDSAIPMIQASSDRLQRALESLGVVVSDSAMSS